MIDQGVVEILLIEDSTLTLEQLRELIGCVRHPVNISVATTETDAIAALTATSPAVVVLDLRLKEGWGFNVLRTAAAMQAKPFVVVLTNYALPKYRDYALLSGADCFLDKALGFGSLPTIIESFISSRLSKTVDKCSASSSRDVKH